MKPNATTPPNTPSITRMNGRSLPRLMIIGFSTLSTDDTTTAPHSEQEDAPRGFALREDQPEPAGIHTSGGPTGTGDRKNVTQPEQRRGLDADDVEPDRHQHALRERGAENAVDDGARRGAGDLEHVQAARSARCGSPRRARAP